MIDTALFTHTEDELDVLVSVAIRRAEILEDQQSPAVDEAWREVAVYEQQIAAITDASGIAGGIARVGAVRATLTVGDRVKAERLAAKYLAEPLLPAERRAAMERAFQEDRKRRAQLFPASAKTGRLYELPSWQDSASARPARVFPLVA